MFCQMAVHSVTPRGSDFTLLPCTATAASKTPLLRPFGVLRGRQRCFGGSGARRESRYLGINCTADVALRESSSQQRTSSVLEESPDLQDSIRSLSNLVSKLGTAADWDAKVGPAGADDCHRHLRLAHVIS